MQWQHCRMTALPFPASRQKANLSPAGLTPRRGAVALGVALALHLLLLPLGRPKPEASRPGPPRLASMQTRPVPPDAAAITAATATEPEARQAPPQPKQRAAPSAVQQPAAPVAVQAATRSDAPTPDMPPLLAADASSPRPTQAAPRLHWQYQLLQGGREGEAVLRWEPTADAQGRYQASLERRLDERVLPAWRSEGRLDAQGLAPERFAQARDGRERQATNFRREQGLISFSASTQRVPLPTGVQDRLSWMLQLSALLSANPALRQPGALLELPVAGLRGEPLAWRFEVRGSEALTLPVGRVEEALHVERAALGPYEARIEVWLDPARHFLPVRLRHSLGEQERWEIHLAKESLDP